MTDAPHPHAEPLVIPCRDRRLDDLLTREFLLTNRIGAYCSSTVVACNTRRYHGLLVAATQPPMGRVLALSQLGEHLEVGGDTYELSTMEFPDVISPRGASHLVEFRDDAAPTFVFRMGEVELARELILAESANTLAVRYTLRGGTGRLRLMPFVPLRDFHHLRKAHEPHQLIFERSGEDVVVQDRSRALPPLVLSAGSASFEPGPQWWYRFHYRADLVRGQDASEDLYTPGAFELELPDGQPRQLRATLNESRPMDFDDEVRRRRERLSSLAASVGPEASTSTRRLAGASDAFVVRRRRAQGGDRWTILAGYHWFADWGRDTFIALPGLLLTTGRYAEAREVFQTFADHLSEGMIPNFLDERTGAPSYNSIDASLWFVIAAERYAQATGDEAFWHDTLLPAVRAVLSAYRDGTRFGIRADADGLLTGGSLKTQLTWMDASVGDDVVTPRHGKCVEVNAMWYCAHRILADRAGDAEPGVAEEAAAAAERIAAAFNDAFWNEPLACLYDVVSPGHADGSIRPNQVIAVSLPYSPLPVERQKAVVRVVGEKLLTPVGLRSLDPHHQAYRRRYGGSWESRDRAYHQGTVWAWLIGPFVEAYLRVNEFTPLAVARAKQWLEGFTAHLGEAGIGTISEIFDGDPPHTPRGCIAQAWSVAEVLRVRQMVEPHAAGQAGGNGGENA